MPYFQQRATSTTTSGKYSKLTFYMRIGVGLSSLNHNGVPMFRQLFSVNSTQDWILALVVCAAFMLALILIRKVALHQLTRMANATHTWVDDFFVDLLLSTRILLAAGIGLYVATQFLNLPAPMEKLADRAFVGVLILQVGFWSKSAMDFWLEHQFGSDKGMDAGARAMTRSLLTFSGRVVLWSLVILLVLENLGLNVTALMASLGIGGIAVALAAQNILGDLFASLSIAIDKPFVIGDFIIVDDLMGTVEHVGLKTTRIRSLGGEQLIFSNTDLLKSRIRNYKRMQERRAVFGFGVAYDTPVQKLEQIPDLVQQAVLSQKPVRFDRAHLKTFGASSLDFEVVYIVLDPDFNVYMTVQQGINLHLLRVFAEHQIEFAFPTRTLHIVGGQPVSA